MGNLIHYVIPDTGDEDRQQGNTHPLYHIGTIDQFGEDGHGWRDARRETKPRVFKESTDTLRSRIFIAGQIGQLGVLHFFSTDLRLETESGGDHASDVGEPN